MELDDDSAFPIECDPEEPLCQICGDHGGANDFVQCENVEHGCTGGQHLYCFKDPRKDVPEGKFWCSFCQKNYFQNKNFPVERPAKLRKLDSGKALSSAQSTAADPGGLSLSRGSGTGTLVAAPFESQPAPARQAAAPSASARTTVAAGSLAQRDLLTTTLSDMQRHRSDMQAEQNRLASGGSAREMRVISQREEDMRSKVEHKHREDATKIKKRLLEQRDLSARSLKQLPLWQGSLHVPGQAVPIRVKAQGVAGKSQAGIAAKRLSDTLVCRASSMAETVGLRDDEAADAAVLLMTAATDDVRSVTELSQLCRTLQQKCEILQLDREEAGSLVLMPNTSTGSHNSLWVGFVSLEPSPKPTFPEPAKAVIRPAGEAAERMRVHWPDRLREGSPAVVTFPEGPRYHDPEKALNPHGAAGKAGQTQFRDTGADGKAAPNVKSPLQEKPLSGFKYALVGFRREQVVLDRMKAMTNLGAQHIQRPSARAGVHIIILHEHEVHKGLQHASKGHREEEGHAMDDIAQFLLDVQGATRFFKGLAVLDTIISRKSLPALREMPAPACELLGCGVIIFCHPPTYIEAMHDGHLLKIWDLQEEGRRRSQGMGTWKLKMTSADVSKLSELNPEAAQSFMDRFGTATGRLKDHEESKGVQEDPPKEMRDVLKLAHANTANARHVILMTNKGGLLAKMITQNCVHCCRPAQTVQLLQYIVNHMADTDADAGPEQRHSNTSMSLVTGFKSEPSDVKPKHMSVQ